MIIAIGQEPDASPLSPGSGVFFCGDMVEGSSTVIQAVASAQKAVAEIQAFLGAAQRPDEDISFQTEYSESRFNDFRRSEAPKIQATERVKSIHMEDVAGLSDSEVQREACRCVSCGCLAVGPSDLAVALVALDAQITTTKRTLAAQEFFSATLCKSTVLESDELIKEVRIPRPPQKARQSYLKFTLRKPIDFAIVSVASIIRAKKGVCSDARIVLGAVAPAPLRAFAAEASIREKRIDENTATEAAWIALTDARPLSMNDYKVKIARSLVKRSILGESC